MISTLFLLFIIAFQFWYFTSKQVKLEKPPVYLQKMVAKAPLYRIAGGMLVLLATVLFVVKLGWMSGITASIIGLMGAGSLVVSINPFRFLRVPVVVGLYAIFLFLEFFV